MKTLNVKQTTNKEVSKMWGMSTYFKGNIFVRCNVKGEINWNKALIYASTELIGRNNVNLLK